MKAVAFLDLPQHIVTILEVISTHVVHCHGVLQEYLCPVADQAFETPPSIRVLMCVCVFVDVLVHMCGYVVCV